jgi:uncharacterized protein YpmS
MLKSVGIAPIIPKQVFVISKASRIQIHIRSFFLGNASNRYLRFNPHELEYGDVSLLLFSFYALFE